MLEEIFTSSLVTFEVTEHQHLLNFMIYKQVKTKFPILKTAWEFHAPGKADSDNED